MTDSESRVVQLPPLSVRANIVPRTVNEEDRTVEVIFTTGAPVQRKDWWTGKSYFEVLSMDPKNIRLDRFNQGAPLLDSHNAFSVADMLGAIVPGSVELTKTTMIGRVQFSKRDAVEPVWQDVRDGLIRSLSIGYRIYKFIETPGKTEEAPVTRLAVDWEPFEASMVPIPADAGAKVRGQEPQDGNACEIVVTRAGKGPATPAEDTTTTMPAAPAKETKMTERSETIVERDPLPPAPAPADTPEPTDGDRARADERARVQGILTACRAARLPQSFADRLINEGVALVEAQSRVFTELAGRDVDAPRSGAKVEIRVGDDPLVHVRAGIQNALLHRVAPDRHKLDDVGRAYRGMSMLDIGKAYLSARGIRITNMSRSELVEALLSRGGMHSTSDFPNLLEDVAHKNLRSAYEALPQTWMPISQEVSLTDFKPSRQLQIGDAPGLEEILEHGEFTYGTIGEAKETVQLKTYGRIFAITRQALINDDLNSFGQVPAAFGRKARDLESDLAWAQITTGGVGPTMGDGVALFNLAGHGNYMTGGGSAAAISIDSLGVGRKLIRQQKGIDGVTPLNLTPQYLIVPAAKETIGEQFISQNVPAENSKVNPFGPTGRTPLTLIVEPRLDATPTIGTTAWYLAVAASQAPVLYHATLDGQTGPDLRQQEGYDVDGLKFRCRLDVGFKAADWRAIFLNTGA